MWKAFAAADPPRQKIRLRTLRGPIVPLFLRLRLEHARARSSTSVTAVGQAPRVEIGVETFAEPSASYVRLHKAAADPRSSARSLKRSCSSPVHFAPGPRATASGGTFRIRRRTG